MGLRDQESRSSEDCSTDVDARLPPSSDSSQSDGLHERALACIDFDSVAVPPHPLSVKPAGNAYAATKNIKRFAGLFATLPDGVLIQVLDYLDAAALQQLQRTCKVFYAYTRLEDLWKTLYIQSSLSSTVWRGTWRSTYLGIPKDHLSQIRCDNLFSDILHRPYFCANTPLLPYANNIPIRNIIPRMADMTASSFTKDWTDRPFLLTKPVREWPVYRDWSLGTLLDTYGDVDFRAEVVNWPLKTYVDYMNDNGDESPLYLGDSAFAEKMDLKIGQHGHYWAPDCFGEDLFSVLGDDRPDSRWVLIGPKGSGSTFHLDPNATSAWNAVLKGSKYWIMFPTSPSQPPPPGIFVSDDQSEVTSPLSVAEWLIGFHNEARRTPGCMEGVCAEGEVLYVPSGWWHLAVNLEPTIAISHNFVHEAHLADVLNFLKNKSDQISGFKDGLKDAYGLFVQKMESSHPGVLDRALKQMEVSRVAKKRKWDEVIGDQENSADAGGFSFGFGDGNEEDIQ